MRAGLVALQRSTPPILVEVEAVPAGQAFPSCCTGAADTRTSHACARVQELAVLARSTACIVERALDTGGPIQELVAIQAFGAVQ